MNDDFAVEEINFSKEVGKTVVATLAVSAAMVVGIYVGTVAIEKIDTIRTNRRLKKAAKELA